MATSSTSTKEAQVKEAEANGDAIGHLVRDNLIFLLGLAPLLIAMMRVAVITQGDTGAEMTLVRTLDVRTLIIATFVRSLGLFLAAASGYLLVRIFWPVKGGPEKPAKLGQSLTPPLVLIFLLSVLSIYPEELLDTDRLTGWDLLLPRDLVRSTLWVLVASVALSYLLRFRSAGRGSWRLSAHVPEVLIIAPVVLLLFWTNVATNERMWLPTEVVTISSPSGAVKSMFQDLDFPKDAKQDHPVVRVSADQIVVVAQVLSADANSLIITTPAGGLYTIPRDPQHDVKRRVCQDFNEPFSDLASDSPLIRYLPGTLKQPEPAQTPVCNDLVKQILQHQA